MQEIERKYLVKGEYKSLATARHTICQGYLCRAKERTVRVRIKNDQGYLTIKGESDAAGVSRYEWEQEIPLKEATELLALCEPTLIEKERYIIPYQGVIFEVDAFKGAHQGLVIAEVELASAEQPVPRPSFLGKEVTGDARYYNAMLSLPDAITPKSL